MFINDSIHQVQFIQQCFMQLATFPLHILCVLQVTFNEMFIQPSFDL